MNFHLNKGYDYLKPEIINAISNFNSFEAGFGTGKRNSVKKIELGDKIVIVKAFKIPNLINKIVYKYFRKSKAKRSFEHANKLIELGFNTPIPIGYIENFSIIGLGDSYYLSEFFDYDITFRDLSRQPDFPNREALLKEFTKFTHSLHEKGVLFLDHSPGNTLIKFNENNLVFTLVDLNRMTFKQLSHEERIKNFSRLTNKKDIIEIISDEYSRLIDKPYGLVFEKMWAYTEHFFNKFHRKKKIKRLLLNKNK